MEKIKAFKSLIYARYDSESAFARDLGWSRQRLNRITNGRKEPDLDEVQILANKLGQSFSDVANIFLSAKSPNGEQSN